jgi:hypothetical protein
MTSGIASYTLDEAWQARFFDEPLTQWTPDELIRVGTSLPAKGFAPAQPSTTPTPTPCSSVG